VKTHDGSQRGLPLTLDADVVVVGSGAGGAVAAAVLAEAGHRVIVLEEGQHVTPQEYGVMTPSQQIRRMWRESGLTFAIGVGDSPVINVMMGKCVGGSSALTGGVLFRTPGAVLKAWQTTRGLPQFTEEELAPYFEEVERVVHAEEVPAHLQSRSSQLFNEGATKLGHPLKPIRRNTHGCEGHGRCNFGCPKAAKQSVDLTWLPRAVAAGAQVWTHCLVDRVIEENGRAAGVEGWLLDGPRGRHVARFTVYAPRVVLAAGAYHTPLICRASGIGRASGQVGRNLTLHPAFRFMARFDEEVRGWSGALQSLYADDWEHDGITLTSMFVPPGVLAATMPGIGPEHVARARQMAHLGVFGGMIHDEGGGTVRRGPGREPLVTYRMAPKDKATVPKLMRLMADIWFAAGAKEVFLPVLGLGGVTADKFKSLHLEGIKGRDLECGSQHPLGTCRMGPTKETSVVDPEGECWELPGVTIADGSVVPTSLGVNPQLSIMTLALRTARRLAERLPRARRVA
jgi:choline dehydrogenase-like flavoprotein